MILCKDRNMVSVKTEDENRTSQHSGDIVPCDKKHNGEIVPCVKKHSGEIVPCDKKQEEYRKRKILEDNKIWKEIWDKGQREKIF